MSEEHQLEEDVEDRRDRVMPDRRRGQAPLLNGVAYRGLRNIMIGVTVVVIGSSITNNILMYGAIENLKAQVAENTTARREGERWTAKDAARQGAALAAATAKVEARMERGLDELGTQVWQNKQEHTDHSLKPCHEFACEVLKDLRTGIRNGSPQ